ncbi:hypothetical protein [Kribbella yunnanensis]|uniref:hypothetical protein n=1 Tax=Kribbella yunnanensis TaxID=190194 RepID=UPI0031DAE81D
MSKFLGFLLGVAVALAGPAVFGVLGAPGGIQLNTKGMALAYGVGALVFWAVVSYFSGAAAIGAFLAFGTLVYCWLWIPNRTTNFLDDVPGVTTGMVEGTKQYTLNGVVPILTVISLVYAIQLIVRSVQRRRSARVEAERLQREQEAAQAQQEAAAAAVYPVAASNYPAESYGGVGYAAPSYEPSNRYGDLFDEEPERPRNQADEQTAQFPVAEPAPERTAAFPVVGDEVAYSNDETVLVPSDRDETVVAPMPEADEVTVIASDESDADRAAEEETRNVAQQAPEAEPVAAAPEVVAPEAVAPEADAPAGGAPVASPFAPAAEQTAVAEPAAAEDESGEGAGREAEADAREAGAPGAGMPEGGVPGGGAPVAAAPEAAPAPVAEAPVATPPAPAAEETAVAEPAAAEEESGEGAGRGAEADVSAAAVEEPAAGADGSDDRPDGPAGGGPAGGGSAGGGSTSGAPASGVPAGGGTAGGASASGAEGGGTAGGGSASGGPAGGGSASGGSASGGPGGFQAVPSASASAGGEPVVGRQGFAEPERVGQQYRERMEDPEDTGEFHVSAFEGPFNNPGIRPAGA